MDNDSFWINFWLGMIWVQLVFITLGIGQLLGNI